MAIARYFGRCWPDVHAVHEPPPSRWLRICSCRYVCGKLDRAGLLRQLVQKRRGLLAGIHKPIYVESNPYLWGFLDVLNEAFDRPHVLHIVRDVRTYIRSAAGHGMFHGLKALAGRYMPYWQLKPELYQPASGLRWIKLPPTDRVAWYWNAVNRYLDRGAELFGERYKRVKFEELFSKTDPALPKLAEWLGLPPASADLGQFRDVKVNASRYNDLPPFEQWPAERRQWVLDHCGELMKRYGYEWPPEQLSP